MSNFSTELENAYYNSIKELKEGDIVQGKIVSVGLKEVVAKISFSSTNKMPSSFRGAPVSITFFRFAKSRFDNCFGNKSRIVLPAISSGFLCKKLAPEVFTDNTLPSLSTM